MGYSPPVPSLHGISQARILECYFVLIFQYYFGYSNAIVNPLQCFCLENPRDGGAWWAAIYGVAQSRTRLKRLSSSSSSSAVVIACDFKNQLICLYKTFWWDFFIGLCWIYISVWERFDTLTIWNLPIYLPGILNIYIYLFIYLFRYFKISFISIIYLTFFSIWHILNKIYLWVLHVFSAIVSDFLQN